MESLPYDLWDAYIRVVASLLHEDSLSPEQMSLLTKFGERLLPYEAGLLAQALSHLPAGQRERSVRTYLAGREDISAWMDALNALCCPSCNPLLFPAIVHEMMSRFATDAPALAQALLRARGQRRSQPLLRELATALLDADEGYSGERDVNYMMAMQLARGLARRRTKKAAAKPRAKKPAAKKPAAKKPAAAKTEKPAAKPRAKKPPAQVPLPLEPEVPRPKRSKA